MAYITGIDGPKDRGCIFCVKPKQKKDAANHILVRGKTAFVMLNRYPYNNGHLMIVPNSHLASLVTAPAPLRREMMDLAARSEGILRRVYRMDGLNLGMNLGRAAGAGVEAHFHLHLVPRWDGDTNFMTVVGRTRVTPEMLEETYRKITAHFPPPRRRTAPGSRSGGPARGKRR
jgi:ATP adenylyltransferase